MTNPMMMEMTNPMMAMTNPTKGMQMQPMMGVHPRMTKYTLKHPKETSSGESCSDGELD
jgi:hypothetical protein